MDPRGGYDKMSCDHEWQAVSVASFPRYNGEYMDMANPMMTVTLYCPKCNKVKEQETEMLQ